MPNLEELIVRLGQQFLDGQHLAVPVESKSEAFKTALAELNAFLGKAYSLQGLDGSLETSLPAEMLPALLTGAAAGAAQYCLQQRLAGFNPVPGGTDALEAWTVHLWRQFDALLDRQRLLTLQADCSLPYGSWPWFEPTGRQQ